jgi:hypothetical protein
MAKVTLPLMSGGASGKVADALVFFPWKGIAVVRQWLKPSNPMTTLQGNQRMYMGGSGRAAKGVKVNSNYHDQLQNLNLIPAQQTKQSFIAQQIIQRFLTDSTEAGTLFEAEYTAYAAHAQKAAFDSNAVLAGLVTFNVSYKGATHSFVAGLQLYLLAKLAIALAFTGAPYTTALADWSAPNVGTLKDDLALPA